MKKLILSVAVIATALFTSCSKSNNETPVSTDITYKAGYVVNGTGNSISVIDLATNEVKRTITLTNVSFPHHISLSPDKSKIAVGVPGMDLSNGHSGLMTGMPGQFIVLNATTGELQKTQNLPLMNHNAIYSPDGSEIWVAQMDDMGKVLVYNATTYALKNTITVGMMPLEVTFSSDGMMAFVTNSMDNTVSAIDVMAKTVMATISVGTNPIGAWQGGDNKMYVDNEDGQSISIINVSSMAVTQTVALGFMPGIAQRQNDMSELWVTDPMNGKVHWWTYNTTTNLYVHGGAVNTGAGAHAIAFNGMTAYVTNQTAGTVSVVDVMTHAVTKTITVGAKPNGIVLKL